MSVFTTGDSQLMAVYGIKASGGTVVLTVTGKNYDIDGVIRTPPITDDATPGSQQGTRRMHLFVQWSLLPVHPVEGDIFTVNGVPYKIRDIAPDTVGGAVLLGMRA